MNGAPLEFHGNPVVTPELVIVGSDLRQENAVAFVYAFERESGKVRWKTPVGVGAMADILSIGDSLFVATLEDRLICLEQELGKIRWQFEPGSPVDLAFRTSSPATDGRRIYFAVGAGVLHAVDANSGKVAWKCNLGARPTTSVAMLGERLYVGTYDKRLRSLKPETGEVDAELTLSDVPLSTIAVSDGLLFLYVGERGVAAVEPSLKALRWNEMMDATLSTARPTVQNRSVFVGSESGLLRSLKTSDGTQEWSETFPNMVRGIGFDDQALYLGTLKGEVYAWSPSRAPARTPSATGEHNGQ